MKKTAQIVICLIMAGIFATVALAAEGGNPKKGKHLYKKTCKSCHTEGAGAKPITPLAKTQAQWDRFFIKTDPKKGECLKGHSPQDIKDINQFLYDHAADSNQPETCG
jgi:cytochrome c5